MFAGGPFTLRGKHYQVEDAIGNPLPVQDKLPLLIAGQGPKVLLRLVAEYADQWNAMGSPEIMKRDIDIIARHGDKLGRDTSEIEKTVMMPLCYTEDEKMGKAVCELLAGTQGLTPEAMWKQSMIGGKDACLERVAAYEAVGVTHFIFMTFPPFDMEGMQRFGQEVAGYPA